MKYIYKVTMRDPVVLQYEVYYKYFNSKKKAQEFAKELLKTSPLSHQGTLTIERTCTIFELKGDVRR